MKDREHASRDRRGSLSAKGLRFGLVASRFNDEHVGRLVSGALECLAHHGAPEEAVETLRVPGAFEIPLALAELAAAGRCDALVALGVVIRGETPHFDYVCAEASRGVSRVSLEYRIPIGFGVLTCDTVEQVEARTGGGAGNKGWEAALAALEMAHLVRSLRDD